ncbi:MAG TPA: hypothetical protein VFA20_25815 [Myxococcaceae bacterium]|nr:hypothetical protein [Myxococcaceae bacterium]
MLTTLHLALPIEALDLIGWFRSEIVSDRFTPDPAIIFSLFRALDRKGKISLAASACGSALDTPNFVKLISRVYETCVLKGLDRNDLALAVSRHASFYWNISTPGFVRLTRQLLFSRSPLERGQGALCVESLAKVPPDLCLRLAELVRDRLFYVRANAWSGANALLYRGRLSAEAYQSLLRDSLTAIKDKDKFVRGNARLFRRRAREKSTRRSTVSPSRQSRPSLSVGLM